MDVVLIKSEIAFAFWMHSLEEISRGHSWFLGYRHSIKRNHKRKLLFVPHRKSIQKGTWEKLLAYRHSNEKGTWEDASPYRTTSTCSPWVGVCRWCWGERSTVPSSTSWMEWWPLCRCLLCVYFAVILLSYSWLGWSEACVVLFPYLLLFNGVLKIWVFSPFYLHLLFIIYLFDIFM